MMKALEGAENLHSKKLFAGLILLMAIFLTGNAAAITVSTNYNFNNCGSTSWSGPSQSACDSSYSGTNLAGDVNVVGSGIQEWSVPSDRTYTIEAAGAEARSSGGESGGNGAVIRGTKSLNAGTTLRIVVGQRGNSDSECSGGAGGSFVVNSGNALVIAGGGGGPNSDANGDPGQAGQADSDNTGSIGYGGGSTDGSGGGGWNGDGSTGGYGQGGYGWTNRGDSSKVQGGSSSSNSAYGGYGGGASTHGSCGGAAGGGGYTGGDGQDDWTSQPGGGAGSYIDGSFSSVSKTTGGNSGFGYVQISATQTYYPIIESISKVNEGTSSSQFTLEVIVNHEYSGANDDDISSCDITVDDNDGNSNTYSMNIDRGYGNGDQARCYQTITPSDVGGWEKGEMLDLGSVTVTDNEGESTSQDTGTHRLPNFFLNLEDSSGSKVSGVTTKAYDAGTSNIVSTGSAGSDECNHNTGSNGWIACGLPPNSEFDIEAGFVTLTDIDTEPEGEETRLRYNQYDSSESGDYYYLDITTINQIAEEVTDADFTIRRTGTEDIVFESTYNKNDGQIGIPLDQKDLYDLTISTGAYQSNLEYTNIRVPDTLESGENQNFIPESTLSNSIKFSAGHVLPAQTFVTRPFGDFDVVNVSIEKDLKDNFQLVSDVMVRKFNVQFEGAWQDWSNRRTVKIKEIYDEQWSDGGGGNDNAWGTIEFNPEGNQKADCSDVRLTDSNNNVQDYTITQCEDSHVIMDYNVPIDAAEEKNFRIYYGNAGASDAQTAVQRPSRSLKTDFDTGATAFTDTFTIDSQNGNSRLLTVTVPQNIDFTQQNMVLSGARTQYNTNSLPVGLNTDHQDFSGIEIEPQREYMLEGVTLQLASTTVDTELVIKDQSTGSIVHTQAVPDNGAGEYTLDFTNTSKERTGDNFAFQPGTRYFFMIRDGQARRHANAVTSRPMYNLEDTTVHRQLFSCQPDATGCTEGDYPTLVSGLETVDPDYPTNVTVSYDGSTIWSGPEQLRDDNTIDLSSSLQSEDWRRGDPINSPLDHDFTISSDSNGNITATVNVDVQFEHPVLEVTKDKSACTVNPETRNYFFIDRNDCAYLDRLNVSQGQWIKANYRFRTPGPHDFSGVGDTNQYNVSDTLVRFDILTETEEFTG